MSTQSPAQPRESDGRFGTIERPESSVALAADSPSTHQTEGPIEPLSLRIEARRTAALVDEYRDGLLDLDPPYQRGSVWTEAQRIELIRSMLSRTPVPAIIIISRWHAGWMRSDGVLRSDAVVDGKQARGDDGPLVRRQPQVPASWFSDADVESTVDTDDGPYVTFSGLTMSARTYFKSSATIPVATAVLNSVEEEARLYLRVNGSGTAQTDADLDNARRWTWQQMCR